MRKIVTAGVCGTIILALLWVGAGPRVSPEMQECLQSHGSLEKYAAVLKKYCSPEMIGQAIGLVVIMDPQVIGVKHSGKTVCYLVEGSIADASTPTLAGKARDYSVCWENGRVVALDFNGGRCMAF